MPTINVDSDLYISGQLGRSFTYDELQDLLFDFGLELEDEYVEVVVDQCSGKTLNKKMYKIEVPANRYDLLCGEGISKALKSYLGISPGVKSRVVLRSDYDVIKVKVSKNVKDIRPYIVCAVLRDITFTRETYESFISLQEKLHIGLCRERTLASMGTHDLDKIAKGDIRYDALKPSEFEFIPLNKDEKVNGYQLIKALEHDSRLNKYASIIKDFPLYPVVLDSNNEVMSLPPIINSNFSKITLDTKNVFIECTATDINKAKTFVDVVCSLFSEHCNDKFGVYPVKVDYGDSEIITPTMNTWNIEISVDYVNSFLGTQITGDIITNLLLKMGLHSETRNTDNTVKVYVPPTRKDIISESDIVEDIAIAYGYRNIESRTCPILEVGAQQPGFRFAPIIRRLLVTAGYIEVLTFTLCSMNENSTFLRKKHEDAVVLSNPKATEYEVVRTSLVPSLLKTLSSNQSNPLPIKIFEVSDAVLPVYDENNNCTAKNDKRLCALTASKTSCFEIIHGLCNWIMASLGIEKGQNGYLIEELNDNLFLENRSVSVLYKGEVIGSFGVVHPEVLNNFGIFLPCSLMEIRLEPFINNIDSYV